MLTEVPGLIAKYLVLEELRGRERIQFTKLVRGFHSVFGKMASVLFGFVCMCL